MNAFSHRSIKLNLYGVFLALFVFSSNLSSAQDGEKLFKSYCASCHYTGDNVLVGPGMKGVTEKYEMSWILEWVKGSQALIKSGDAQAIAVYEKFNKVIMPNQPVNEEEIKAIFAYVDETNAAAAAAVPAAGAAGDTAVLADVVPVDDNSTYYIFFGAIIILLIVIGVLRKVNYSLDSAIKGGDVEEEKGMWSALVALGASNRKFVVLFVLGIILLIAKAGWDTALNVGVYTGYEPEQPIKFSHQLHAGENKIDCNYCHSGARNSKSAGIPSANLCMNCHTYINEGPQYGKEEIAKIYKALDFDPVTKTYGDNTSPIKWIKVHNLPDHVYFNHSQHVTVGQIDCAKCHGPVEEYTVGKQFAPLTMGWCIDCHRETKVQTEGNGYYDEIHKRLPADIKAKYLENGVINVDELGGIECAKCHY
jgi:mono/diheme cytochrome c family protein